MRTNRNSINIFVYDESGKYIGEWPSITQAAKACNVAQSSISDALYYYKDHFAVKRYWLKNPHGLAEAMAEHTVSVNRRREQAEAYAARKTENKRKAVREPEERHGDYVFVKYSESGDECCSRCALGYISKCLPCREHEGHAHGYWRYSRGREREI